MATRDNPMMSVEELNDRREDLAILDCRFSLADPDAGEAAYREGHILGAHYLHLERDLSGPVGEHGGRHPLPDPAIFNRRLAELGVGRDTPVVAYDESGFAFAARCWWMMKALGYTDVRVLNGGLEAWRQLGGITGDGDYDPEPATPHDGGSYAGVVDIAGLRTAQAEGAILVDSREEKRYQGLEEPIDPVAGHIPGAVNYPWQGVTGESGYALGKDQQVQRWAELDKDRPLIVYCGSGVTACVNLLSLKIAGRDDARLYAGSWSDWCTYMEAPGQGGG
jgi:thiosulfate/3-mercaptopyruvate sulfurtransferase